MSTATDSIHSSPPVLCSESRGSSVSSDMREEYEDLLRYAVVMPVSFDAKLKAFKGNADSVSEVVAAETIRSTPQPEPVPVRVTQRSSLRPQVRKVDFVESDDTSTVCSSTSEGVSRPHPVATPTSSTADRSLSLQASLDPPFKPPAPYTAMNIQDQMHSSSLGVSYGKTQPSSQYRSQSMPEGASCDKPPASKYRSQSMPTSVMRHEVLSMWPPDQTPTGEEEEVEDWEDIAVVKTQLVDPEMSRLGTQLDGWCYDLKKNILAEFEQSRIRLIECQLAQFRKEKEKLLQEINGMKEELERLRELLATYEHSITRKDHIISNLTKSMQKQKEKFELQRNFNSWKQRHTDEKREAFTSALAQQHHCRRLKRKIWEGWFGVIRNRWKSRVERACQMKAEETCMELTDQYEEKMASVHQCLENSRQEVVLLKAERDQYEENTKKAFMRGVCALNLEAMTMFKNEDEASCNGEIPPNPHPPPPPTAFPSEGTDCQRAQLSAHMHHLHTTPATIADMRPLRATECLTVPAKSVHINASSALDRDPPTNPSHPLMATGMLPSIVHHQHVLNRQGTEVGQYPGDGGIGGRTGIAKPCVRCIRGGTKPPAVFVQRHSE